MFTLDFEGERQVATVDGKAGDLRFLDRWNGLGMEEHVCMGD